METPDVHSGAPGRLVFADQEKALLRQLLQAELPPIARIRQLLEMAQAETVAELIEEHTGLEFTIDYYFRLLPARLGARIISSPRFSVRAAVCLFYCQLLRPEQSAVERNARDRSVRGSKHGMEAYWRLVAHEKLTCILRQLIHMGESRAGVFSILHYMDRDNLVDLLADQEIDAKALLAFFRDADGDVYELFEQNLDLFDFVCRLASEAGDDEFLERLSDQGLAATMMELRIAETLIDEATQHVGRLRGAGERRELPLSVLVHLLDDIPPNVRRLVLERLEHLGHIPFGLSLSFMEQRN